MLTSHTCGTHTAVHAKLGFLHATGCTMEKTMHADVRCALETRACDLGLLTEFMGVGKECEDLTTQAMDGTIDLSKSLEDRLNIINCKPSDVKAFLKAYPPEARLEKGIAPFIKALQARGTKVYLISGGFRELMLPISRYLGVPPENIFANRMLWQWDDETQSPSKLVGFDTSEPTSRNQGKPEAIATIRNKFPYNTVVMIGDGATDLEAVQVTGGADLFIGYGGVVERPAVKAEADWFVTDYSVLEASLKRYKVAMIGYGAWASTAMTMVAKNALPESGHSLFEETVQMWVGDEDAEGGKLADVINQTHQNPNYLPGVDLGSNVVANADLLSAVDDADVLIFCAPLQQLRGICTKLVGKVKANTVAVSMIEGMRIPPEGPQLISETVSRFLNVDCSVLMGAHITTGIAEQELSEAVVAYNDRQHAAVLQKLFQRDYFHVELVPDVAGAELCGTLKNIVALAAGVVDGLGFGANTKSAIVRQGMDEMRRLSQELYPAVRDDTFLSSCGIADVMASCLAGPHRDVAMEYTKAVMVCLLRPLARTRSCARTSMSHGQPAWGRGWAEARLPSGSRIWDPWSGGGGAGCIDAGMAMGRALYS
mmetsp:Transcript_6379/g.19796  ORF Transcript_6379/g.19796 Transcript_6379/m.19796 type:complete len:598 (-) Transcript_6379:3278-5071(-)